MTTLPPSFPSLDTRQPPEEDARDFREYSNAFNLLVDIAPPRPLIRWVWHVDLSEEELAKITFKTHQP